PGVGEPGDLEHLGDAPEPLRLSNLLPLSLAGEHVRYRQGEGESWNLRRESDPGIYLARVLSEHEDGSLGWLNQSGEQHKSGSLAARGRAEEADSVSRSSREGEP